VTLVSKYDNDYCNNYSGDMGQMVANLVTVE